MTDLWPFTWPLLGLVGDGDRDDRSTGDGMRFSAAVDGLMSLISSRSSSESEEGKKRSGWLFNLVGAAGDGEGVNCIVAGDDALVLLPNAPSSLLLCAQTVGWKMIKISKDASLPSCHTHAG